MAPRRVSANTDRLTCFSARRAGGFSIRLAATVLVTTALWLLPIWITGSVPYWPLRPSPPAIFGGEVAEQGASPGRFSGQSPEAKMGYSAFVPKTARSPGQDKGYERDTAESWIWVSGEISEGQNPAVPTSFSEPILESPDWPGSSESSQPDAEEKRVTGLFPDSVARETAAGPESAGWAPQAVTTTWGYHPNGRLRGFLAGCFARVQAAGKWGPWIEEPGSAGVFSGYAWGTELVDNWVEERDGWWGGVRFGWDWQPQYGVETRLSVGSIDLWDHPAAVAAAQRQGLNTAGDRYARSVTWDVGLLYYATRDDPWQPYIYWGLGMTRIDFADLLGESYEGTYFTMPLALGLKVRPVSGPVLRLEFADHIIFPSRFNVTHQFSATVGLEMRFGKKRRLYWPWESASR